MQLTFCGAAGEVTGSCYWIQGNWGQGLIDCGMFQGGMRADLKNRAPFPFNPRQLDFVILTHAHLDHSGLLPKLAAEGFRGDIYCTMATADLLGVLLPDSAHIQEKDAEWRIKHHRGRMRPTTAALYDAAAAEQALKLLRPQHYHQPFAPVEGLQVTYRDAGHILGSAFVELQYHTPSGPRTLVASGDVGQPSRPIVKDPEFPTHADYLLIESTYGNRLHKGMAETLDELTEAINITRRYGGNVVIPAFAVGRTQDMLYLLGQLTAEGRIDDDWQIYVDSPMATKATDITLHHFEDLDAETRLALSHNGHQFLKRVHFTETVEDSMAINKIPGGAIILSASGMCDAGRIRHHLRWQLPHRKNSVVIVGFQAMASLGRRLVDSAKKVRLFGREVEVAARVFTIGGLSAHADQAALMNWASHLQTPPRKTWVVHGEAQASASFRDLLGAKWPNVAVAEAGATCDLSD